MRQNIVTAERTLDFVKLDAISLGPEAARRKFKAKIPSRTKLKMTNNYAPAACRDLLLTSKRTGRLFSLRSLQNACIIRANTLLL